MQSNPAIEFRNLTRYYGLVCALNNVSFSVARGEVFGYVGANGAGKTTTIKVLTGLLKPTAGDALVCGTSILTDPVAAKSRLGYIPESGALFEKLTPREYLTSMGRLYKLPEYNIGVRVNAWLGYFGLADRADFPLAPLSKGNKQKVCWIAAMLHEPEILVLDEPLSGLDVEAISAVKELMSSMAAAGKTIFYSSHLIDVVEKVCTRIAVLDRGTLVGMGSPEEVRNLLGASSLEEALLKLWRSRGQVA